MDDAGSESGKRSFQSVRSQAGAWERAQINTNGKHLLELLLALY